MADVHDKATRSYNMSKIRNKDTLPELVVRKWLFSKGYRFRLHAKKLPGKPDIVLPKYNTVVFINGCFWHGHENCKYFIIPETRKLWWLKKIMGTKQADESNVCKLKSAGWKVVVIFECELRKEKIDVTLRNLQNELH